MLKSDICDVSVLHLVFKHYVLWSKRDFLKSNHVVTLTRPPPARPSPRRLVASLAPTVTMADAAETKRKRTFRKYVDSAHRPMFARAVV